MGNGQGVSHDGTIHQSFWVLIARGGARFVFLVLHLRFSNMCCWWSGNVVAKNSGRNSSNVFFGDITRCELRRSVSR